MAEDLHGALMAAHAAGDGAAMATLYAEAAETTEALDERMFFLTQAYIFALEAGDAKAPELRAALQEAGRI